MITVRVKGLAELLPKLEGKFLITPEFEHVRERLMERINRRRKGAGYRNNPLDLQRMPIGASGGVIGVVGTPLNAPRVTGSAWKRFVYGLVRGGFLRNQMNAAAKRIAARWGS